jgi:Sigma-70, region 4
VSATPVSYPPCNILPFVWAVGARLPIAPPPAPNSPPESRMDLYREYTEALLRRYVKMSMEAGKVPSLVGQELLRGNVTRYRVGCFADVVIFLADIDRCLNRLNEQQRDLVERMAIHQYTLAETAEQLGVAPRTVLRRYGQALDHLSRKFLDAEMLEPLYWSQDALV